MKSVIFREPLISFGLEKYSVGDTRFHASLLPWRRSSGILPTGLFLCQLSSRCTLCRVREILSQARGFAPDGRERVVKVSVRRLRRASRQAVWAGRVHGALAVHLFHAGMAAAVALHDYEERRWGCSLLSQEGELEHSLKLLFLGARVPRNRGLP